MGVGALGKQRSAEVETRWRVRNRKRCGEDLAKWRLFFHVRGVGIQDILCPAPEEVNDSKPFLFPQLFLQVYLGSFDKKKKEKQKKTFQR